MSPRTVSPQTAWSQTALTQAAAARRHADRMTVVAACSVVLAVAAVVAVFVVWTRSSSASAGQASSGSGVAATWTSTTTSSYEDTSTTTTTQPVPRFPTAGGVAPSSVSASCVSPPGKDAAGTPFSYEADKAVDGYSDTAWRCDSDGVGQSLTIGYSSPVLVSSVSVVPGFAKTDPFDGTDRYRQCRRIAGVRLSFSDGTAVTATFDTDPGRRGAQSVSIPTRATSSVTLTILSSVPGEEDNRKLPIDKVAISEMTVS